MGGVSGPEAARNVSSPAARERNHPVMNALSDTADDQQHGADAALEQLARHRTVDLSCHASHQCMKRARGHRHRPIEQRGQIVRQHLLVATSKACWLSPLTLSSPSTSAHQAFEPVADQMLAIETSP